ncbi:HAD-superfamily hydrolase [Suhomyces tanzawaensis NRRL Y-17324]|uniref:HAD-superfamily hydrolase n=1 Tax=Suhomyces tanzawaensis NRRL Y-17324 TaxID=984487 RepID=A0A1E4SGB2_9ASCO|nr:HAD-superfamily hydrolase [Suhomyces tanzawaensis NRRL Y-17324]ODV78551.1 HAD-superfamily hydrolase [Suhomyces tanzawaensis NRRL Y-17324]
MFSARPIVTHLRPRASFRAVPAAVSSLARLNRAYSSASNEIAFVFDIDGVLLRGSKAIPQASRALELLDDYQVPYILMTNGGGISESARIEFISSELGVPLSPLQIVQSHTPMKALAHKHAFDRVLVVGGPGDQARKCAQEYGFQDVVMPIDIVRQHPEASPHHRFTQEDFDKYAQPVDLSKPIEAILVFNDPRDMGTDIQIVLDLLNSEGGVVGTKRNPAKLKHAEEPAIPIIFSNNDFIWANDYNLPRFGQGAFRIITENLYKETNRLKDHQHLHSTIMGKPFKLQYDFAHHVLIDWRRRNKLVASGHQDQTHAPQILPTLGEPPKDSPFHKIYMVGDNPESDIKGANDHGWESMLLRTGVYKDEDKNTIIAQPTAGVHDNVLEAVRSALRANRIL